MQTQGWLFLLLPSGTHPFNFHCQKTLHIPNPLTIKEWLVLLLSVRLEKRPLLGCRGTSRPWSILIFLLYYQNLWSKQTHFHSSCGLIQDCNHSLSQCVFLTQETISRLNASTKLLTPGITILNLYKKAKEWKNICSLKFFISSYIYRRHTKMLKWNRDATSQCIICKQ